MEAQSNSPSSGLSSSTSSKAISESKSEPMESTSQEDLVSRPYFLKLPSAPVFYPTEEEFRDPLAFFHKIYKEGEEAGICKIVPPKNWRPPFSIDPDTLEFIPRVQILHLLEAKQRMMITFHNKINNFWSMFGVCLNLPIKIQDHIVS